MHVCGASNSNLLNHKRSALRFKKKRITQLISLNAADAVVNIQHMRTELVLLINKHASKPLLLQIVKTLI